LPANREQIAAELRGMILRWVKAGRPLNTTVRHPFSEWAKVIGGILDANGFTDFLANYGVRKSKDDPLRKRFLGKQLDHRAAAKCLPKDSQC
jgi:hypothetical protein